MEIDLQTKDSLVCAILRGRIDTFGAGRFEEELLKKLSPDIMVAILDFEGVNYLSSAGLRALLRLGKELQKRRGNLALIKVSPYCQGIIKMSGFDRVISQFPDMNEAIAFCTRQARVKVADNRWDQLEKRSTPEGEYRFIPGDTGGCALEVAGSLHDILHADASLPKLQTKLFPDAKYSIGIGGLGEKPEDFFPIMGVTVTVGGVVGWLPSDGHGMADIIIPQTDNDQLRIHTVFNITLPGHFHESVYFDAAPGREVSLASLYRDIFEMAKMRRTVFKGAVAVAMRAQMVDVFGSGLKKSPISKNAPPDGKMVTHPVHIAEWFDIDQEPRHRDVTALVVGTGADLTCALSGYSENWLDRVFYIPPSNTDGKKELLRNHAVIFSKQPVPERPVDTAHEIRRVIEDGEFLDVRQLLDNSTVDSAIIGISYIDEFKADSTAVPAVAASPPTPRQVSSYKQAADMERRLAEGKK